MKSLVRQNWFQAILAFVGVWIAFIPATNYVLGTPFIGDAFIPVLAVVKVLVFFGVLAIIALMRRANGDPFDTFARDRARETEELVK